MSVSAALQRVQQLESMLDGAPAAAPAAASSPTAFSQQLASASLSDPGAVQAPASPQPPTTGSGAAGGSAAAYQPMIDAAAAKYGIDPSLLSGLVNQESGFNPSARSSAGAEGLTQLMPGTAAALGVSNPLDPAQSIDGGARYLREQLDTFGGDVRKALAAYNAGAGAVQQYGGVPPYPETQNYVQQILAYAGQQPGAIGGLA